MPGYKEGRFQSVLNNVFINDIKVEVREARFGSRLRCVKEMQELIRTHAGDRKYIPSKNMLLLDASVLPAL